MLKMKEGSSRKSGQQCWIMNSVARSKVCLRACAAVKSWGQRRQQVLGETATAQMAETVWNSLANAWEVRRWKHWVGFALSRSFMEGYKDVREDTLSVLSRLCQIQGSRLLTPEHYCYSLCSKGHRLEQGQALSKRQPSVDRVATH